MSGQLAVKTAEKVANKFVNKVLKDDKRRTIFGDTDSIGLEFKDLVARFNTTDKQKTIDMLVKVTDVHMAAVLKEGFALLGQTMNAWNPQIKMARENIADRAIWTAKKHYVMNVVDSKGIRYSEPKLKIVGLEAIKQTIPMICKENLKKGMKILLEKDNTEVVEFAQTFKKEFFKLKPYEIASPRGISNVTKYQDRNTIYIKGTPMHVRAALLYNYLLKKHDLENKYQVIRDGNKIRYLNLKLPNPLGENVIAFIDDFPEEFGLTPYIDYNIQYEKCFEAPLKQLTDACGLSLSNSYSFDQFFA
jgi:DNA polymerase elongation subunit (family B)